MAEQKLTSLNMSFEPNVIEHLGVKLYSHTVPALAELVANSYDACASNVKIIMYDNPHKIIIKDDGVGMTFDEINDFYLRIGRNRRNEKQNSCEQRKPTGKKGLGKLALFGLGKTFQIETIKNGEKVSFILDYDEIMSSSGTAYQPKFSRDQVAEELHGTTITLSNLKKIQDYPVDEYSLSLAKLFNFPDPNFSISIQKNSEAEFLIDNSTKYQRLEYQFKWDVKDLIKLIDYKYADADNFSGEIFTSEKPLKNNLKGITLFANGRMVNQPEFFKGSESSHFYSYATGYINIDFIDNYDEDLISTDRTSLDWNHESSIELRRFLAVLVTKLEQEWRAKKKIEKEKKLKEETNIQIEPWLSKVPLDIKENLSEIINAIDASELPIEDQNKLINTLHKVAPEYTHFHYRHLHPEIQNASKSYYQDQNYYQASIDSIKRYVANVRKKSGDTMSAEKKLMETVFGPAGTLSVTAKKSNKPNGIAFAQDTLRTIEIGQMQLSQGVLSGCRNPLSHEEIKDLEASELFTEADCLDVLSILSHLHKRLDDA